MMTSRSVRRFFYLVLLVGIGGAAVVRIAVLALALLGIESKYSASLCPVPVICILDDPMGHIIDLLIPVHATFGAPAAKWDNVSLQYVVWYGAFIVALLIVALVIRRLRAFRAARSLWEPQSFSGLPYGLAVLGIAFIIYGYFGGSGVSFFSMQNPGAAGAIYLFVAFLLTEISSLGRAQATDIPVSEAQGETLPRPRPIWSVISLLLPLLAALSFPVLMATFGKGNDGFAGMAAAGAGVVIVVIGMGLGAIGTAVAYLRKERWVALQVVAFAVNFGIGLPMIVQLLRAA